MLEFGPDFRRRCEAIYREAAASWGDRVLGRRIDRRLAAGIEVTGFNDYSAGDDYRYVDWHRCARLDELVTKQYRGSADQQTHLLIDVSASMRSGGKLAIARQLLAALGYVCLRTGDRVRATAFAAGVVDRMQAVRGISGWSRLAAFCERIDPRGVDVATDLAASFSEAAPSEEFGLAVVISDLFDPRGFERPLERLQQGRPLHVIQTLAEEDLDSGPLGGVSWKDLETGSRRGAAIERIDRIHYRQAWSQFLDSVAQWAAKRGIGWTPARADEPVWRTLGGMVRQVASRERSAPE